MIRQDPAVMLADLMRSLLAEQRRTNALLSRLANAGPGWNPGGRGHTTERIASGQPVPRDHRPSRGCAERGCKAECCVEARRTYYREYKQKQREEGVR